MFQGKQNITGFMIWIGKPGSVTPTHYDQSHVFLSQIIGHKKVTLFSPSQFGNMYSFPAHHSHDRQSQVNFDGPDLTKFPRFENAQALETIIGPGEVLFIPAYWWHYVESLPQKSEEGGRDGESMGVQVPVNSDSLEKDIIMSIRFTFFRKEKSQNIWVNKIQLIRTIERIAAEQMGEKRAHEFLRDIALGKLDENSLMKENNGKFWNEIVKYSNEIMEDHPQELASFVKVMVQGRFEYIPPL